MNRSSISLRNERCEMCLAYEGHSRRIRFAFRLPLSAAASSLSGLRGGVSLRPFDRIDRVDRSTTKGVQYIVRDCIAVHVVDAASCNENQEKKRKRKSRLRGATQRGGEGEGRRGKRRGKRRGCRVAASCNELHKRKRSHVILNEGLLRLLCPHPPLSGPSFLISLSLTTIALCLPFLPCVRIRRASALFFPPPGRS